MEIKEIRRGGMLVFKFEGRMETAITDKEEELARAIRIALDEVGYVVYVEVKRDKEAEI